MQQILKIAILEIYLFNVTPLDFLRELWRPKYLYQSIAKWDGSESTNTYSLSINYDFLFIYIVNAVICVCIMDTFFLDTTFPIPTKFGTLNRPTRSASRALILVLYRPLSCKPNFRYHIVRQLQTCSICPITILIFNPLPKLSWFNSRMWRHSASKIFTQVPSVELLHGLDLNLRFKLQNT